MATNISRYFKDISFSFSRNPLTNDIIILQNEDAIKKSVTNLVRTQVGERFFNDLIGTSVQKSLFELDTEDISILLNEQIENLLKNFEPRISVINVDSEIDGDLNELNIKIQYNIVGLPYPTQNIDFLLQASRL
jgi:phage baseplate assembly protein W